MRKWLSVFLGISSVVLVTGTAVAQRLPEVERPRVNEPAARPPMFFVRSYGGKCLDFGPPPHVNGAPVFIFECNGTIAQQIRIEEINNRHEVILRAGNKVLGVKSEPVVGPVGPRPTTSSTIFEPDLPLELQEERDRNTVFSRGQIFTLDGDSIILVANRDSVVKIKDARSISRTPLVLGRRELSDSEFWTLTPTDGSNRKPTSGFVRVPQEKDLVTAISDVNRELHPGVVSRGTVIEVDAVSIDLTDIYLRIPEGVTIRGNRRGANFSGELRTSRVDRSSNALLEVIGYDVRITGLRIRGPSRDTDQDEPSTYGIVIKDNRYKRAIVDHNDMSDWTKAAVIVQGPGGSGLCADQMHPRTMPHNARIVRNFIHHNRKQGKGYGVVADAGGYPLIEGNTFYENRHAIAADENFQSKYRAWYNLVLASAPGQKKVGIVWWHTHDFDSHGSGANGFGGQAGAFFEIHRNTFLGKNRNNYKLRGSGCYGVEFHRNISLRDRDDAVRCDHCGAGINSLSYPANLNRFESANPTNSLGVGDFDGDGTDDLFLATGEAWYYAPQGVAEWRFLNPKTDGIAGLHFGDFDADGRTDVFKQHGRNWLVSWGGASPWEKINESNELVNGFRLGDFNGDRRADVFYADGHNWLVSDGGTGPLTITQDSGYQVKDLGFGDFNADGNTDVVGVVTGRWMVSLSAREPWEGFPLRSALTSTMGGLIVADFNGNGRADIATQYAKKVSYDGRGDWVDMPPRPGVITQVGRFDARRGVDILFYWRNDNHLGIQSSGVGSAQRHSRQHMR